jgi:hypothetical protein
VENIRLQRTFRSALLVIAANAFLVRAQGAILYESGALGSTGLAQGSVAATNVTQAVFTGVRFQLAQPAIASQVGGHFVGSGGGTFFGALVKLDGADDFPDSGSLSTPDVLGTAQLTFPTASAEVYGNLALSLDAGWYALVFGSGLFGTSGDGAAPQNNPDLGSPEYIAFQPNSGVNWLNITSPLFMNHRFVVIGTVVPEPAPSTLALLAGHFFLFFFSKSFRASWRIHLARRSLD